MDRRSLNTDACPKPRELERYAGKRLFGKRSEEVFLHLKRCAKCLRRMASLTRLPTPEAIIRGEKQPGWWQQLKARLGRPSTGDVPRRRRKP